MVKHALNVGRYLFLILLTLFATAVMWWVSRNNDGGTTLANDTTVSAPPTVATPKSLVNVNAITPVWSDVKIRYSGKVRAWESYSLGFELGGRVSELGVDTNGEPLDDGAFVTKGQVLARLDDRVLRARYNEAVAQYELAGSDLERSRRIHDSSPGAISESEYQGDLTEFALRRAAREIAAKNLEDAVLVSPIDGVIYRRMVEPGESVSPHITIFEIVQNDRLRLVLSIPESRIRELEMRRRVVSKAQQDSESDEANRSFKAFVRLEGTDVRGRDWPSIDAQVYRIAQVADSTTGLFEVEVVIPNDDGLLRPGMVATAELVTDRVLAYQVPERAILFRAGTTYLFTVEPTPAEMQIMFWGTGQGEVWQARRVEVHDWIDQGETMLLPASSYQISQVVIRGQQRLGNGELVRVVPIQTDDVQQASKSLAEQSSAEQPSVVNR